MGTNTEEGMDNKPKINTDYEQKIGKRRTGFLLDVSVSILLLVLNFLHTAASSYNRQLILPYGGHFTERFT